jgi:hypothetical protein
MILSKRLYSFVMMILLLSIFFPEVGVVSFTDIQPNFLLLSTIVLIYSARFIKISMVAFLYFCVCILFLWLSIFIHISNVNYVYILTYLTALITVLLCYLLCSNHRLNFSNNFLLSICFVYFFVAFIQFFIPDFLISLVTRGLTTDKLLLSGRGMMSLTGEPAHFGKIIIILNVLYAFKVLVKGEQTFRNIGPLWISVILFVLNCILSQSFYACFFHLLILIAIIYLINRKLAIMAIGLLVFIAISFIEILNFAFPDHRIVNILSFIINDPEPLLKQGAMVRALNVPLSLFNLKYFGIWGSGNSPDLFIAHIDLGIGTLSYVVSNRLYGGVIEYVLKMGVLSIPIVVAYIYMIISIGRVKLSVGRGGRRRVGVIFSAMLVVLSLQDGSPASPLMIFTVIYLFIESTYVLRQVNTSSDSKLNVN